MIIEGYAQEVLPLLPSESVNCVITSPPYWGLRDYGLEPVVWDGDSECEHEWVDHVRKPQGGRGSKCANVGANKNDVANLRDHDTITSFCSICGAWRGSLGLEPSFELYIEHLIQIFNEIKRVLRKDGTCWVNLGDSYSGSGKAGKNPDYQAKHTEFGKPSTHKSRFGMPTTNCSMPAKSLCQIPSRFAIAMTDAGWILRNELIWYKRNCMPSSAKDRFTVDFEKIFFFTKSKKYWFEQQREGDNHYKTIAKVGQKRFGGNTSPGADTIREDRVIETFGRNKRCVWDITTKPFKGAHFAVFPRTLVEPMLSAGCPVGGWVVDPFAGVSTVGVVAEEQGKTFTGIEPNPDYCVMGEKRLLNGTG